MSRSTKIFGRVSNKLRRKGLSIQRINDEEIYCEMNVAQDDIMSRVKVDRKITLNLLANTSEYDLERGVGRIDEVIKPRDWIYDIKVVDDAETYDEILNSGIEAEQPLYMFLSGGKASFYPTPKENKSLSFFVLKVASTNEMSAGVEPEVDPIWDHAIYLFTVSQFLDGKDSWNFKERYEEEIENKAHIQHDKYLDMGTIEGTW